MILFKYIFLLLACECAGMSQSSLLTSIFMFPYRLYKNELTRILGKISENPSHLFEANMMGKVQDSIPSFLNFPCDVQGFRSLVPPSSVHQLRPGDVDLVAALGDTSSSGRAMLATTWPQVLLENRGVSWSAGGQGTWRQFLTLPNILKMFNPNLLGYSDTDSFTHELNSWFNAAEDAAICEDLELQAKNLIRRIQTHPSVDITGHWKLITMSVGMNDICQWSCTFDKPETIINKYREDLISTIRMIKRNLPRTLINLVPVQNLRALMKLKNMSTFCAVNMRIMCPCLYTFIEQSNQKRRKIFSVMNYLQRIAKQVSSMPEFQTDDFSVIFQPFAMGFNIPELKNGTDFSYLSPDCYHLSQKTSAEFANAIWNNMLEPVNFKSINYSRLFQRFLCPSSQYPYIFTQKNSEEYQKQMFLVQRQKKTYMNKSKNQSNNRRHILKYILSHAY